MKILIVSHYYPPHIGGLEIVAQKNARTLCEHNYDVTVVTCAHRGQKAGESFEDGVHVFRLKASNFFDTHFGIPTPLCGLSLIKRLSKEVKRADVVHIHDVFYQTSWVGYMWARWYKKPVLLTQHVAFVSHTSMFVMLIQRIIYASIGAMIFRGSSRIIAYNKIVKEFLEMRGVKKVKIAELRNGVNIDIFRPANASEKLDARSRFDLPIDRPLALFVGRHVPKKGFNALYDARDPSYDLVFAGSGNVNAEWSTAKNVHFLGPVPRDTLAELYRAADICVLPTRGELFTLTMQEALASALPVITSDEPEYQQYEIDRDQIIFCAPLSGELKTQMKRLFADTLLQSKMSHYSRTLAEKLFDENKNEESLIDIYKEFESRNVSTIVTTSWDDGHVLDIKLAELLKKYALSATFYISPEDREIEASKRLNRGQVYELSKNFEIGAHTMTHPYLPQIDDVQAKYEIVSSKELLEDWIRREVKTFAYPKGGYTKSQELLVKNAGFVLGRTVSRFSLQRGKDLYAFPTSMHTYDHWSDVWPVLMLARFNPISFLRMYRRWDRQAVALFDRAHESGGLFHLWGHSWEVEQHNDWERLERVFSHIARRAGVRYLTNAELV